MLRCWMFRSFFSMCYLSYSFGSIYLSFYISMLLTYLYIHIFFLFIYLSIHLSISLTIYQSIYISIYLPQPPQLVELVYNFVQFLYSNKVEFYDKKLGFISRPVINLSPNYFYSPPISLFSLSLYDGNLIHTPIKCDVIMKNNHIAKRHFENWCIVSASVSVCTVASNFQNGTK